MPDALAQEIHDYVDQRAEEGVSISSVTEDLWRKFLESERERRFEAEQL